MRKDKSPFERIKQSQEAREKNINLPKKRSSKKTKVINSKKVKKKKSNTPAPFNYQKASVNRMDGGYIHEENSFYLYSGDENNLDEVKLNKGYVRLAKLIEHNRENKGINLFFSWPFGFDFPAAGHVLANMGAITRFEGNGFRACIYPSGKRSHFRYRDIYTSSKRIHQRALKVLNEREGGLDAFSNDTQARIKSVLSLNDVFNNQSELTQTQIDLSVRDLFPSFQLNQDYEWEIIGDSHLKELHTTLWHTHSVQRREADIEKYAYRMSDASTCTNGIYRISNAHSPNGVRNFLLDNNDKFDVIIIDARNGIIDKAGKWKSSIIKLIMDCACSDNYPGLILITDDVNIYKYLYFEIKKGVESNRKKKNEILKDISLSYQLFVNREIWKENENKIDGALSIPSIEINVSASDSINKISKIFSIANDIEKEVPQAAIEIRKMAGFVNSLIDSPVSQKKTIEWANEFTDGWSAEEANIVLSRIAWQPYKNNLLNLLSEYKLNDNVDVESAIKIADKLCESVFSSTKTEEFIKDYIKITDSKKLLILIPNRSHIQFLEDLLSTLQGIENKIIDVECQQRFNLIGLNSFDEVLICNRLENTIDELLICQSLPRKVGIFCSAHSAKKCMDKIETLLSIEEFSLVHPRGKSFLNKLKPLVKSARAIKEINMPDFHSYEDVSGNYITYDGQEPHAVIFLGGYGGMPVQRHTIIIKHNKRGQNEFLAVDVEEVFEGDSLLVFDERFRNKITQLIGKTASEIVQKATRTLETFISMASETIASEYSYRTRKERAKFLRDKMKEIDLDITKSVSLEMVSAWVKGIEDYASDKGAFEVRLPQKREHFNVFCNALNIDESMIKLFWGFGVHNFRVGRIFEGRIVGNTIKAILMDNSLGETYGINEDIMRAIKKIAYDSVYVVYSIDIKTYESGVDE